MRLLTRIILALTALSLALSSCERRPLIDPALNTNINILVNIKAMCNVTCDIYNDKIPVPVINPDAMRVVFFDPYSDEYLTEAFVQDRGINEFGESYIGGPISIIPGKYRILIYSEGLESVEIENANSFEQAKATSKSIPNDVLSKLLGKSATKFLGKSATKGVEDIVYQPDHILVARSFEENIPWHSGTYTIHAEATSLVESYYLQIKIDGLQWVSSAQAILSGMAAKSNLMSGEMDRESPASLCISLVKSQDKGEDVICNVFNTFGRIPDSTNDLEVTFNVHTVDGRTVTKTFDISGLFDTPECIEHHWLLLEEHIVIDPPGADPSGGGGYQPVVEDWEEERRDLEL